MHTGKSLYIGDFFLGGKFDAYDDGWVYWLVVVCKLLGGMWLIIAM